MVEEREMVGLLDRVEGQGVAHRGRLVLRGTPFEPLDVPELAALAERSGRRIPAVDEAIRQRLGDLVPTPRTVATA